MTGSELQRLRESTGMERVPFARALGYSGEHANIFKTIKRYEMSDSVPPLLARLAWLISHFRNEQTVELDHNMLPKWPEDI